MPWDSAVDYLNWFHRISHPFVQPPNKMRSFPLRIHLFISNKREIAIGHARDLINASIEEGVNIDKLILLSRENRIRDLLDEMSKPVTVEQEEEKPDVRTSVDSGEVRGGGSERRTKSRHEQRFYVRRQYIFLFCSVFLCFIQ